MTTLLKSLPLGVHIPCPMAAVKTSPVFFPPEDREAHTAEEFITLQRADARCSRLMANLKDPKHAAHAYHLVNGDGVLVRRRKRGADVPVVPMCLRAMVLRTFHGLPLSCHPGRRKTLQALIERYWWPGMRQDVTRWCRACLHCARRKTPRPLRAGAPAIITNAPHPWHTACMDLQDTRAAKTADGSTGPAALLTIIDLFSRYGIAIPLPNKSPVAVATALFRHFYTRFGRPRRIMVDRGGEFINAGIKRMCDMWEIRLVPTTGLQPQALPIERWHRWLNAAMTGLHARFGGAWTEYLPAAVFAYNNSIHDSTGYTPHELIYRQRPELPADVLFSLSSPARPETADDYFCRTARAMTAMYQHARRQQRVAAQRNQALRAGRAMKSNVTFGDSPNTFVLFFQPQQGPDSHADDTTPADYVAFESCPSKWQPCWTGPHRLIREVPGSDGNIWEFTHCDTGAVTRSHVNRLTLFTPWSDDIPSTSYDIDRRHSFLTYGAPSVGSLAVVPLHRPYAFGVGRVHSYDGHGNAVLHWFGSVDNAPTGTLKEGWRRSSEPSIYYSSRRKHHTHKPYLSTDDGLVCATDDIMVHSFCLTSTHHLPRGVLRTVSSDSRCWWTLEEVSPV